MDKIKQEIMEEFDKRFDYWPWNCKENVGNKYISPTELKSFLSSALDTVERKVREEIKLGLSKTWSGCACGYHGYQTLPDCEKENHYIVECADCLLSSLSKNSKGEEE